MPIGNLGILLSITFFGAMISQITLVPLADKFGRKRIFEISVLIMLIASILSVCKVHCRESGFSELQPGLFEKRCTIHEDTD